jgi:cytoskeleton protein RodZ
MASTSPFGEHLRREREMRGVSLEELSSATRISTRFLSAIESGRWDQLPGGAFNRGFIRSASHYLGLDEDGMVAEYSLETNDGTTETTPRRIVTERSRPWKFMAGIAGTVILLICLLLAGWFARSRIAARRHASSPATAAPAASAGDASSTVQSSTAPLRLVIRASSLAHVRVVADGKSIFVGEIKAKNKKEFAARETFQVSTQDPGAVRLELNGQPIPPIRLRGNAGSITLTAKDAQPSAGGVH